MADPHTEGQAAADAIAALDDTSPDGLYRGTQGFSDRALAVGLTSLGGGGGGGGLPDPITTSVNIATDDPNVGPLVITLPPDFDEGWYDAIEINDANGLRLLSFDVGGALVITANPVLGSPNVRLGTDGSTASIVLQQGSDTVDAAVTLTPGDGQSASVQIQNANGSVEHYLGSGASPGQGLAGFYGHAAVARPTGVAVTAEAIHAALVTLGLITA